MTPSEHRGAASSVVPPQTRGVCFAAGGVGYVDSEEHQDFGTVDVFTGTESQDGRISKNGFGSAAATTNFGTSTTI